MGEFTFRAQGWESPETATVADTALVQASDDDGGGGGSAAGARGSHYYHHHVHHHYHYHVAKAARRRHDAGEASDVESAAGLGLEQDPLTLWHSAHAGSGGGADSDTAWMAGILSAHGAGREWADSAGSAERARRATALTTSSLADDAEAARLNPHWDDMITFRQTRARRERSRAWSAVSSSSQAGAAADAGRARLAGLAARAGGRTLVLTVAPVAVVVAWCAVPLRTDAAGGAERLNFWFFLVFYYGTYNAVALALVTQIFRVYALTWWPRAVSGVLANVASWLGALALGALAHALGTGVERHPMAWTALTLLTLLLPVAVSFVVIQRHHRRTLARRAAAPNEQRPLMATSAEWRAPASYRRFLWFCASFLLWHAALAAGEYLASAYIATLPHSTRDELFYVYLWIFIVNALSLAAGWVVSARINSWPLQYVYTLYFFTTYFIFYRNLFARLESPEQVVLLQLSTSLGVALVYPLRMARWVYRLLACVCRWGDDYPYDAYARQLGRAFFLRNKAENATILGFLCWVTILHYGPNRRHYPYFRFDPAEAAGAARPAYAYALTVRASLCAWAIEFAASRLVRLVFRRVYGQNVSKHAVHDFRRYPHVVPALVLVTIHVLQNILFAMIRLDFG